MTRTMTSHVAFPLPIPHVGIHTQDVKCYSVWCIDCKWCLLFCFASEDHCGLIGYCCKSLRYRSSATWLVTLQHSAQLAQWVMTVSVKKFLSSKIPVYNSPQTRATSSHVLFCLTSSPNSKDIQITVMYDKKRNIKSANLVVVYNI